MINDEGYADRLLDADPDPLTTPTEMWRDRGLRHDACGLDVIACPCPGKGFLPA